MLILVLQLRIDPTSLLHQLLVSAKLLYTTPGNDGDFITPLNGGKAMRDHEDRPSTEGMQVVEGLLDLAFVLVVQGSGGYFVCVCVYVCGAGVSVRILLSGEGASFACWCKYSQSAE